MHFIKVCLIEHCKGNLVGRGNTEHSSQYLFWIILIFVTSYPPPWREYNIDNGGQGGSVSHCLIGSRWLFVHFVSEMELKTHYCMGEEESQCLSIIFNLEGYISYLSFALKKNTMTKSSLWKKFILARGSRGTVHNSRGGMAAGIYSRKLRDHIYISKNEAERAKQRRAEAGNFQSPSYWPSSGQVSPWPFQIMTVSEDQEFEQLSP